MILDEISFLKENIITTELYGCDCAVSNVFLYQNRYKISTETDSSIFYRYYETTPNHTGFGFPIPLKSADSNYLKTAIHHILQKQNPRFCYCSENQKKLIDECLAQYFPQYHVEWETCRSDSDYLYLQQNLSELPGKEYQKKRNHISRFRRTYENNWEFKTFPQEDIKQDILAVEEQWFVENDGANNPDLQSEYNIIKTAVKNAESLNILGGVLYINEKPSAMCLATAISQTTLDVLFEKSIEETAENGAYATINQLFAKHCCQFKYLNREEDLGIEGLRKAKLSYKPEIILDKFYGNLIKNN